MEIDHGQPTIYTREIYMGYDDDFNPIYQNVTETMTITDACTVN